jgi:hypothetical protein
MREASNLAPRVLGMARDYALLLGRSRTILNHPEQVQSGRNTLTAVPRKREKPALRAFGARLQHLRGERSRQTISNALRMKGVSLDESTLVGYEQGRVWSVDVGVMRGLSQVFGVTFDELAALLLANRRNPSATDWNDLLRHSDEYQSSASIKEGADVRASVEKERKRYRQYLETLQTAAQATLDDVKERLAELDAEESQSRRKRG